jgi:hypothetical protein
MTHKHHPPDGFAQKYESIETSRKAKLIKEYQELIEIDLLENLANESRNRRDFLILELIQRIFAELESLKAWTMPRDPD